MTMIAWLLAGCAAVPLLIVGVQCLLGLKPAPAASAADAPPFAVLIPAHDEIDGIAATVAAVRRQLRPCDRVLVIADNCADATAEMAVRAGARVCRRNDPTRVGKGFALAFGRAALRIDPPAVVIVLDADCTPAPGALARLAAGAARGEAVQARNLLSCAPDATAMMRISTFAFMIRNLVRQRGLQRIGGQARLQGTGMALPWRMFDAAPLATPALAEDLRLGLDLVLAGHRIRFDEAAAVSSAAAPHAATRTQRTRWEHGALATAADYLPRLLTAALRRRPGALALAADLLAPPLALLVALTVAAGAVLALLAFTGTGVGPLLLLLGATALFAFALTLAWAVEGRALLPAGTLLRLPAYVLWKQPVYARLAFGGERRWVRTSRAS